MAPTLSPSDAPAEDAGLERAGTEPSATATRADRLLPVLAALVLLGAAGWLWLGNGVAVFGEVVAAGLALCL